MGRFGTTNFTIIDQLLKSGKYGDRKELCHDGNQYNDLASSSDVKFCPETMTLKKKTILRGGPRIAPPDDDSPTSPQHSDESAGFSASHRLGPVSEDISESENESDTNSVFDFRAGW